VVRLRQVVEGGRIGPSTSNDRITPARRGSNFGRRAKAREIGAAVAPQRPRNPAEGFPHDNAALLDHIESKIAYSQAASLHLTIRDKH
jgi:hypothetical protein